MATASISTVGVCGEVLERRILLAVIDVDPSFGDAGTAKAFAPNASFAGDMVLVAEAEGGKLLVAGTMVQEEPRLVRLDLARFNADGTPDTTFGAGGVVTGFPIEDSALPEGAVAANGDILVPGLLESGELFVARFTSDGAPQLDWAGDGVAAVRVASAGQTFQPTGIALDEDGGAVVAGALSSSGQRDALALVRLTPQGQLDSSFGSGGGIEILPRIGLNGTGGTVFQPDGRILLVGTEQNLAFAARFNADGTPDTTFDSDGFVSLPAQPATRSQARSVALQEDGRIIVGLEGFVARLSPFGAVDVSLDGDGFAPVPPTVLGFRVVRRVFSDGAGRIVGHTHNSIFRLNIDGTPDTSLAPGARVTASLGQTGTMALAADDTFLVTGPFNSTEPALAVSRIRERPDLALGPFGLLVVTGTEQADAITLGADGASARLERNGVIDTFPLEDVNSFDLLSLDGDDVITVSLPADCTIRTGDGNVAITVQEGRDSITTGAGNDTIFSGDGGGQVLAGDGDNIITTGDDLDGVRVGNGDNQITTNGGDDDVELLGGNNVVDTGAGGDSVTQLGLAAGNNSVTAGDGDDFVQLGDGHDTIFGGGSIDTLLGGDGDNLIFGGGGPDFIKTGAGADTLWGEIGNDTLRGGVGNDYLNGGASKDVLFGQQGDDLLYGGRNNDAIDGGPGIDYLRALDGNDKLFDRDGVADLVFDGGAGDDTAQADQHLDPLQRVEILLP